jgi:hypothetical protein
MSLVSTAKISHFLQLGATGPTMTDRGRALEDLICYVFGRIPGISVTRRNQLNVFNTEEIDVAFWNDQHPRGLYFLPMTLLVECKNWSVPVTSSEFAYFVTKIQNRGLPLGVLIAANGITGDPHQRTQAQSILATALSQGRQIIVITREEIEGLKHSDQIVRLFKEKLCDLAVMGALQL